VPPSSGEVWVKQGGRLRPGGEPFLGEFGVSVALSGDGNTALIGSPLEPEPALPDGLGSGWVFSRSAGSWSQRHASKALELEQCGLCYQRIPPDYRFPYGHTHKEQEEIYVVVRGSGWMKLDDEIVEVKEWDVVRVPPGTWRGYEGGQDGLEILVFGAPNLGENPRDDVEGQRDWWAG
jgi:mannose-6-phosphate isomerase-like protein (cupin superfamily)